MKIKILLFLALFCVGFASSGQDIPLFSQKLTNSFIYNPAMAGIGLGSLTFSHRNNYSGVSGAPKNNFLSFHSPFANYRFGAGVNFFQEEVAAVKTTYASGAFAYHIDLNSFSTLSFGVSGEYNSSRLSDEVIAQNNGSDLILNRYTNGVAQPDFSFGVNYQNRLWKMGFAANRLYSAWIVKDSVKNLANYYSAFLQGIIPLEGARSVIEPYFAYRKFNESNNTFDIGVFYTYDNKITAGLATRSGSIINATLAYRLTPNLLVGYARETILGSVHGYVGSSNEFVMRLDFADRSKKKHFRADYKTAMSYRKKSVTKTSISSKSAGGRNPQQVHKSQKKLAPYSPSKRYQGNTSSMSKRNKSSSNPKFKTSYNKHGTKKRMKRPGAYRNHKYNPVKKKRR